MSQIEEDWTLFKYAPADVPSVLIPSTVKIIYGKEGDYAFQKCSKTLASFSFQEDPQLEIIQSYAFYKCERLQTIDLSSCKHLTTIGDYAFFECSNVTAIHFPENLKEIRTYAFASTQVASLDLPSSLELLCSYAFQYSYQLANLNIPRNISVVEFGYQLFRGAKISTFFVPKSVQRMDPSSLQYTDNLERIEVDPESTKFKSVDGVLMNFGETSIVKYPTNRPYSSFTVKQGVKILERVSFVSSNITSIDLPNTLQRIQEYCFYSASLTSIVLPDSLTFIGKYAFYGCKNLESVILSRNLTSLPSSCFARCNIKAIVIPEGIGGIGSYCFNNNRNLVNVTLPSKLYDLGGGAFDNCDNVSLIFPNESDLYIYEKCLIMNKANTSVKQYLGSTNQSVEIPSTVQEIGSSSFAYKTSIVSINLKDSQLASIYDNAFRGCTALRDIEFPETLESIGECAFFLCKSLTSIKFAKSFTEINQYAFYNCTNLSNVSLKSSEVDTINIKCFSGCSSLESITFPDTLSSIEENAFYSCTSLVSITLPSSLTSIGIEAFCSSGLEDVKFEENSSMEELGARSFYGCTYLSSFEFPGNLLTVGAFAFHGCGFLEITLPDSIVNLSANCFSSNSKLVNFTIKKNSSLQRIDGCVFEDDDALVAFFCYGENFVVETGALLNKEKTKIIAFPPSSPIKYLQIPQGVKQIGDSAFKNSKNLVAVSIPENSVNELCLRAFMNCRKLQFINIPSSITKIGNGVFTGCKKLSCGIPVNLQSELKLKLVNDGGFPKQSLIDCKYCFTKVHKRINAVDASSLLLYVFLVAY